MNKITRPTLNQVYALTSVILALALPTTSRAADYCFGAVGQGCGAFGGGPLGSISFCINNFSNGPKKLTCQVSGGSIVHDECCVSNPYGVFCGQSPSTIQCSSGWDRAVNRHIFGYNWTRRVDGTKQNTSGIVVLKDYCALPGAGIHKNDRKYCCSGSSAKASFFDRLSRPSLYVCTG